MGSCSKETALAAKFNLSAEDWEKMKAELKDEFIDENLKTHSAADVRREVEEAVDKALTEERKKRKFEDPDETESDELKKQLKKLKDGMRKISEIAGQHL